LNPYHSISLSVRVPSARSLLDLLHVKRQPEADLSWD
jgi:hypothetical protein